VFPVSAIRYIMSNKAHQPELATRIASLLGGTLKMQTITNGTHIDAHHIIDAPAVHIKIG
jgi:hypothetical protein